MGDLTVHRNVAIEMRDGVRLAADVYRPAGGGRFPVLLQRTAYSKNGQTSNGMLNVIRAAEERSPVAAVQTVFHDGNRPSRLVLPVVPARK